MNAKIIYGLFAAVTLLAILNVAQAIRWASIESVTARYYELKTYRDQETKRLNAIIHQANGTVESDS